MSPPYLLFRLFLIFWSSSGDSLVGSIPAACKAVLISSSNLASYASVNASALVAAPLRTPALI